MSAFQQNSVFEDIPTISRVSNAEVNLSSDFEQFFKDQMRNFYLAAGYIYSDADLKKLIKEKRPAFQVNLFAPILLEIVGSFIGNLPGIDIVGTNDDDQAKAHVLKELNDSVMYVNNDCEAEFKKAFLTAIIARRSWIKQEWRFNNRGVGNIIIEFYNSFIKHDTSSTRWSDTQFLSDTAWLTPEQIIRNYARGKSDLEAEIKEKSLTIFGESEKKNKEIARWYELLTGSAMSYKGDEKGFDSQDFKNEWDAHGVWHRRESRRLKVVDFYEKRYEKTKTLIDPQTFKPYDVTDFSDEDLTAIVQSYPIQPRIKEDYTEKVYQISVVPGINVKLFEGLQEIQNGNFKFTKIDCFDFHPDQLETKSIVDNIKDGVRSRTLLKNTNLTYIMRMAHGGYLAEEGLAKGHTGLKELDSNKIGGVTYVPNGSISGNRIKEKTVPNPNIAIERFNEQDWEEIQTVSGSTANSRGKQESSSESGKLFQKRVERGAVLQEWVNSNFQSALKIITQNNIYLIQNNMTEDRVVRLLRDENKPEFMTINKRVLGQVLNDVTVGDFDVEISHTAFGREAKELDREKEGEVISVLMQLNPAYVPAATIVKNSGIKSKDEYLAQIEMVDQQTEQEKTIAEEDLNLRRESTILQNQQSRLKAQELQNDVGFDMLLKDAIGF